MKIIAYIAAAIRIFFGVLFIWSAFSPGNYRLSSHRRDHGWHRLWVDLLGLTPPGQGRR